MSCVVYGVGVGVSGVDVDMPRDVDVDVDTPVDVAVDVPVDVDVYVDVGMDARGCKQDSSAAGQGGRLMGGAGAIYVNPSAL